MQSLKNILMFSTLLLITAFSLIFSVMQGSIDISFWEIIQSFLSSSDELTKQILLELRFPHIMAAFVTGGLLALAGCLIQVLLRNPLADPYVLGVSGGAALGTLYGIATGITGSLMIGESWIGSLITTFLVFILSKRKNKWSTQHLLLTGIAIASACSGLISFILVISPEKQLRTILFWLMGDLSFAEPRASFSGGIILFISLILSMANARGLNIFVRGEREAKALGVATMKLKIQIYLLISLCTATAVTIAGCIGFIGLIVPHIIRLTGSYHHKFLLPFAVLLGGSLLTLADALSRTLFLPQQLPVGIVTSLIGIPIFICLLQRTS